MGTFYGTVPFTGTSSPNFLVTTDVLADAINRATSTAPVMTVFGRSGFITGQTGDYSFDQITNVPAFVLSTGSYSDPTWISSLAYSKLLNAPTLASVAISGNYSDLSNTPPFYAFTGTSLQYTAGDGTYTTFPLNLSQFNDDIGIVSTNSPAFIGVPTAPTAPNSTSTNQLATTKFVQNLLTGVTSGGTVTTVFGRGGAVAALVGDYSGFYYPLNSNPSNYLTSVDIYYDTTSFAGEFTSISPFTLATTGVVAGNYLNSNVTVDSTGRITSIANGVGANFSTATDNTWTGKNTYAPVLSASAGTITNLSLLSTVTLSGNATYRSLWISPYEQSTGITPNYLIDAGTNTATGGTGSHTSKFTIDNSGNVATTGTVKITTTSTNQLTIARDVNNFLTIDISSSGNATCLLTGTNNPTWGFSQLIRAQAGFAMNTSLGNSNLYILGATTSVSSTQAEILPSGVSTVYVRMQERGSSNTTIAVGASYVSHIVGTQGVTLAASGTHAILAQYYLKPLTVASGVAAVTNTYTFFIEGASSFTGTTGNNYSFYSASGLNYFGGKVIYDSTITALGNDGAQTINKPSGTVNIAAGGSSVTVTNSLVTANSGIIPVIVTNDATATIKNVTRSAGSFTINLTSPCTGEIAIWWIVYN